MVFTFPENILLTPLWFNPQLRLQILKSWLDSGIQTISDILEANLEPYSLNTFEERFNSKTNFLEYGAFCRIIKDFLSQKILPLENPTAPVNSYLNIVLSLDKKGVSNIYKIMLGNHNNILLETSNKWNEKMNLNLSSFSIGRSFRKITIIDDTYLRYIQFRTLHRRFYTNDILHKIGIKDSDMCSLCKKEKDSNEHMLIQCAIFIASEIQALPGKLFCHVGIVFLLLYRNYWAKSRNLRNKFLTQNWYKSEFPSLIFTEFCLHVLHNALNKET